ncbi:L,D-transpeptidase [Bradyrhizobium erythrophlei]|jgi:lipoprotein-anchoring transpeptidase ErfK/SrfK|uniref:Lipoprotein-anchoring transpeptidase ErfK/SrfK n=1 Tax=Bradyrhizobium erythrophlei TaxID=1437360 RepID=A0A1M7U7S4_9BRAD|nr:Lipoprotein-anchoring transpeptidase ErfK/SrfK [Bradyrhizobium erythrophlei]
MTRIFATLAAALMVLAAASPARATMDDDFFGFRRQQQPMMQPGMQQRGAPYYGPGSDYFGESGGSGPIQRERVAAPVAQPPGTIFISTSERRLYLILGNGEALRYGIGVGRDGFRWTGVHHVSAKKEWPGWTPPAEMRRRRPDLPRYMAGGIENPLGARAMYLGSTLYRIHGSNEPETIGHAVSSGCFRMTNEDVTDLYNRVSVGALVVVR